MAAEGKRRGEGEDRGKDGWCVYRETEECREKDLPKKKMGGVAGRRGEMDGEREYE